MIKKMKVNQKIQILAEKKENKITCSVCNSENANISDCKNPNCPFKNTKNE